MRKKIFTIAVIVVVVFLLALPKLDLFSNGESSQASTTSGEQANLLVEAKVLQPGRLDNKLIITGTVQANESLELKSEASGKITGIYFKEGKTVRRGELLVQINDEEIVAQIDKQKHNRKLNEDNEFRQRKLLEKEAISQEEYDNALNRLNTTMADIQLLEAQLAKTKVYAPFSGVIGLRYVSEGAYISASNPIATLYSLTPAKIDFAVPGRYSTQVKAGKKIFFTIESDTKVFEGEVYAVEPRIDQSTRTLSVRALADNTERELLPGQFVKVELILQTTIDALMVPSEAVVPELNGHKVFLARKVKAEEVKVTIGLRTEREVEIVSGLNPKDTLITTGILQLRQGMGIQITEIHN
jgi:membrane fusion protein (multidrug efflux system)